MDIKDRANHLRSTADERLADYRKRWPPLEFGIEGVRRWVDANGTILAGHLAFRVFSFIVPLYLVVIAILGFTSQSDIDNARETFRFGSAIRDTISQAANDAHESRIQALLIGGFAMLVAGAGLASALRTVYGVIWRIKPSKSALGRLAIIGTLILVVFAQVIGSAVRLVIDGPAGFGAGLIAVFLLATGAVVLVSWVLPRRTDRFRDVLVGSVLGGIGFAALNIATVVYFADKLERSSQVYGSLGVAVTVLLYLFVIGQILVISAIVNTLWVDRTEILAQAHGEALPQRAVGEL